MQQTNMDIAAKSNIHGDCLIINQCDENGFFKENNIRMISTTDRGLSKSRNLALKNATGDICLICDDDGIFNDNAEDLIKKAYSELPDADIIITIIQRRKKNKLPNKIKKLGFKSVLHVSSREISFRREKIIASGIKFDETIGSGVSNAGGEENLFLFDCLKHGLKIYFYPVCIGRLNLNTPSQWFKGYTKDYWLDRGIFTRKMMGRFVASLYAVYFLLAKHKTYKKDIFIWNAMINIFRGIFSNS
ncbi:MAG: glycosyltransferase family 2 protein [Bacteroidales bacterium]|jgi:glycosyltransferase involved in cell wall biosynthesis|nr:glycosyltransferase family 2 protein [Bacteroidales bacterium]